MKGQEFAVKFPYLKETERVKLANLVASVQEKREAVLAMKAAIERGDYNADTSRYNSLIHEFEAAKKGGDTEIDKKIRELKNEIKGKQDRRGKAGYSEKKKIDADIAEKEGRIRDWESQKVPGVTGDVEISPFPLPAIPNPGKRPARLHGPVNSGAGGTVDLGVLK
jgi:hypothetical protein